MSEIVTVFRAELGRKVRSRVFLLATAGGALMIAFIVAAPAIFSRLSLSSTKDVILAGPPALRAAVAMQWRDQKDFSVVASVARLPVPVTLAYLDAHKKAAAAIELSVKDRRLHLDVYPRDLAAYDDVEFRSLLPVELALAAGMSPAQAKQTLRIARTLHPLDEKFSDSKSATFAHAVAFGLIFILYFAIIIASQSVMASVAEEKTSRIAEILVATISPINLLVAKTLSAAALAILQIGVWAAAALLVLPLTAASFASSARSAPPGLPAKLLDPGTLVAFALFFVLGYLQYATIYAAAASLISRTEDLGSVTTPVILPVVGAFFTAQFALVQPNAPLSIAFSFVPYFSPFVMFTRIAISNVPAWQIALAVAINLLTVAASFYAAGKVYRIGMLLYGKPPSLKQIAAALKT